MARTIERMTPEQARITIVDDHSVLRGTLDELDALLEDCVRDETRSGGRLRERALAFFDHFSAHLDLEEALLLDPLRAIAAGDVIADRLLREHKEQREQVRSLFEQLADTSRPLATFANELRGFARLVRIDMEHEDATLLREGLLTGD
jgi:hemerythrin-like domain-containing protein